MVKTKGVNVMNTQTHWKNFEQMEEGKKYVMWLTKKSYCLENLYERQGDEIVFKS